MADHWVLLVALLVHVVLCNEGNAIDNETPNTEPSWIYKCDPTLGCSRQERPVPTSTVNTTAVFESLDVCRTVCSEFGGLWPKPVTAALSTHTVGIHPNYIRYDISNVPIEAQELMAQMTQVTTKNLLAECGGNVTEAWNTHVVVHLEVKSGSTVLSWETNEQYVLHSKTKDGSVTVQIVAETVYGARHGLESFTSLVAADRSSYQTREKCGLRLVASAKITDQPAYRHRGFLLDTSRNFIPMSDMKRMIDGLGTVKMNVFHWHVTDTQSFPLESSRVPQFTRYGAYSPEEIYKVDEVKELIKYAQVRGVRVVIEIDAPAHAGNGWQWGKEYGLGELAVCVNEVQWRRYCVEPPCGQLNPANAAMYRVLRDLYRDVAELMHKPALFHMGGDELFFSCWNSSQQIVSYMQDKGFQLNTEGFIRLWAEFHAKALQIWDAELVASGGKKQPVMLWSSELTQANRIQKYLDSSRYVIEVWEPVASSLLTQLIQLGYRVVSVPKDVWYLDHGFWGITKYSNWRKMYEHELPTNPNVLGGEVAMWTEFVDVQGLDSRVWPRAAAVAERLWSNPSIMPISAEVRMQRLRSRLVARGLYPDAIAPGWCSQNDGFCLRY